MKNFPVKYQIYNLTEAISATAVNDVFRIELLKTWKYLIGIAFVSRAGAGVDNYLTISDNFKTIFDKAPVKIFTKSFRDISKNNIFMPVNIPADGNIIDILFQASTVKKAYDIDVIFVLSNEKTDIKEYNFQTKKITVPSATAVGTSLDLATVRLNSSFKEVAGFLINKSLDYNVKAAVKDSSGQYLLDPLDSRILELNTTDTLSYKETFFPVNFESNQQVTLEIKLLSVLKADLDIDVVFLLKNRIAK